MPVHAAAWDSGVQLATQLPATQFPLFGQLWQSTFPPHPSLTFPHATPAHAADEDSGVHEVPFGWQTPATHTPFAVQLPQFRSFPQPSLA
jgi:hypothetical protein